MRAPGGVEVKTRRERIGMTIKELAEQANVSPDTLSDWERGIRNPQSATSGAVLAALDRLEDEMGIDDDLPSARATKPGMLRFEVTGVYGADALVVEGPIENLAELEAMIDRIMRGGASRRDDSQG